MNNIIVRLLRLVLPRRYWYRRFYLRSKHWRHMRGSALIRAGFRCERCGASDDLVTLDVHHKKYNLFHERLSELEVLCRACHMQEHRKGRG